MSSLDGLPETTTVSVAFTQPSPVVMLSTARSAPSVPSLPWRYTPERSPAGGVEELVVGAVERVLQRTRNVPQVGRSTQQVAIGLKHVSWRNREGGAPHDLDALDLGVGGTGKNRLEHRLHERRRSVVDDKQTWHYVALRLKEGYSTKYWSIVAFRSVQ